jgi:hypothetical protein
MGSPAQMCPIRKHAMCAAAPQGGFNFQQCCQHYCARNAAFMRHFPAAHASGEQQAVTSAASIL